MELVKAPKIYEFTSNLSILAYFLLQKRMEVVLVRVQTKLNEGFFKRFFNLKTAKAWEMSLYRKQKEGLIPEHGFWLI